jgi:acyl-CoA thioesterase II
VAELEADTRSVGTGPVRTADLRPEWRTWAVSGGYVAAVALRAASEAVEHPLPATLHGQFLRPAAFGEATVRTEVQRAGRRTAYVRTDVTQSDRVVLTASATFAQPAEGYEVEYDPMPDVPHWKQVTPYRDLLPEERWNEIALVDCIEERPINWVHGDPHRPPGEPEFHAWVRFAPTDLSLPAVDAARSVILVDTYGFASIVSAIGGPELHYAALTADLTVRFHQFLPATEWLLARARVRKGGHGIVAVDGCVWSEDGRLLASGTQSMLAVPFEAVGGRRAVKEDPAGSK